MARPKTEAALYVPVTVRLPPDIAARLKQDAKAHDRPVNTHLIRLLRDIFLGEPVRLPRRLVRS